MTTTIEPTQEHQAKIAEFVRHRMSEVDVADAGQVFDELRDTFKELAETAAEVDNLRIALDALTVRNASLIADKDDLSRQLRRVEEDRDAAHARAQKMEAETTQRLAASDGVVWQRVKERDAAVADYRRVEAQLRGLFGFPVVDADGCVAALVKIRDEYEARTAEVAALKAKLAEVEAERDAARTVVTDGAPPIPWTTPLDRSWMSATLGCGHAHLSPGGGVVLRCMNTGHLLAHIDVYPHDGEEPGKLQHLHLSQQEIVAALLWSHRRSHHIIVPLPAGAGTEWAAPLAAADAAFAKEVEHFADEVAALAALDAANAAADEKGGAE